LANSAKAMIEIDSERTVYGASGRLPVWAALAVGALMVAVLGVIDYATGSEISFSVFYLAPVLYVTWYGGFRAGFFVALASAAAWGIIDVAAGARYSIWLIPMWNAATRLGFFLVAAWLLQALQKANSRVLALAHTDSLTGLANARSFYDYLEREILRQRRYGSAFTLAYIDLDHFKEVNDGYGHAAGDVVLRSVGMCILATLRESDVVARLGGDEFGVLMPATEAVTANLVLARLQAEISVSMRTSAPGIEGLGATVGAVVFQDAPHSADAAVLAADEAMYTGKRAARGSLQLAVWPR